jgi:hypothetical protein
LHQLFGRVNFSEEMSRISTAELARMSGVYSQRQIQRLLDGGKIPAVRTPSGRWHVDDSAALQKWLSECHQLKSKAENERAANALKYVRPLLLLTMTLRRDLPEMDEIQRERLRKASEPLLELMSEFGLDSAGDEIPGKKSRFLNRVVTGFKIHDTNPELWVECFALVSGSGNRDESMTAIAKRHNITRAAVSKRCIKLRKDFGLRPVGVMHSDKARENFRRGSEARKRADGAV